MDEQQKLCFDLVVNGHNVCILGQAGTGKTYCVNQIVSQLRGKKKISLTCYTGIACLQYEGLSPMTLHKFAGLEDGRHSKEQLVHLLKSDERYSKCAARILETDLLVIDEISMVSRRILNSVEFVCRQMKDPSKIFGGTQLILSGDFFQLPPIRDEVYGDSGDYCFNCNFFERYIPHIVELSHVYRQQDLQLIKAVHELERGEPSEETSSYIYSLSRPVENIQGTDKIKLYARNFDVDIENYNNLQKLNGNTHLFEAEDRGDAYYLKKLIVPKYLGVKLGARVMLLKNLDEKHVNGLVGSVFSISEDNITVDFNGVLVKVRKHTFYKFDPATGEALATRLQFPLKLAYAITIHKSQGMSLPLVEVNCKSASAPGQIGVAIGRAMSSGGLSVTNYSPNLVKKHSTDVYNFYENFQRVLTVPVCNNCCCQNSVDDDEDVYRHEEASDSDDDLTCELCDFDSRVIDEHSYAAVTGTASSRHDDMEKDFSTALIDFIGTPSENVAQISSKLIMNRDYSHAWYSAQCLTVQQMLNECSGTLGKFQQKNFTDFYTRFQQYISSDTYLLELKKFSNIPFSSTILTSVMFVIQSNQLKKLSEEVEKVNIEKSVFPSPYIPKTDAGRGTVRYVGGYCIAKCRYRLCSSLQNCLFKPGMEPEVRTLSEQINILDKAISTGSVILSSSIYPETLKETERKQNVREGLTNITDSAFEFFETLEKTSVRCMQYETLSQEKKLLYRYVLKTLVDDRLLLECFITKFCVCLEFDPKADDDDSVVEGIVYGLTSVCCHVIKLFDMIVKLFVTVIIAQFRKDYLRVVQKEKGLALRKKILQKSESKCKDFVPIQLIEKDSSSCKISSHFKLKAMANADTNFDMCYKKAELQRLLEAYGERLKSSCTKKEISERLRAILTSESCTEMVNYQVFERQQYDFPPSTPRPSLSGLLSTPRPPLSGPSTSRPPLSGLPSTSRPPLSGPSTPRPPLSGPPTSGPPLSGPPTPRPPLSGPSTPRPPLSGPSTPRPPLSGPSTPRPPLSGLSTPRPPLSGPSTPRPPLSGPSTPRPPLSGLSTPRPPLSGPPTSRPLLSGPSTSRPPLSGPSTSRPPLSGPSTSRPPLSGLPSKPRPCAPLSAPPTSKPPLSGPSTPRPPLAGQPPISRPSQKKKPSTKKRKQHSKVSKSKHTTESLAKSIDSDRCNVCEKFYIDGEDWISCDSCLMWYHRACVHLEKDEEWEYFSSSTAVYICLFCQ